MMIRQYKGRISYINEESQEFGFEEFRGTVYEDGTRILRAMCVMNHVNLVRDVTYSMQEDFSPIDCFVRVSSDGRFIGSGWFRFTDDHAEGEIVNADMGRVSQRFETPGRVRLFGSHPIVVDSLKARLVKAERPGELQRIENAYSSSLVINGASGPMMAPKQYDMFYRGPRTVEVGAGQFDTEYFDWDTNTGRVLQIDAIPGDWVPARVVVPQNGRRYELVEFSTF